VKDKGSGHHLLFQLLESSLSCTSTEHGLLMYHVTACGRRNPEARRSKLLRMTSNRKRKGLLLKHPGQNLLQ
jgi:hypothetical protein